MKPLLLEVIGQDAHYQLRLTQRLSVISGDSATGKTALINTVNSKNSVVNCSLQVFTIPSNTVNLNPYKDCCILVDLDALNDVNTVTALTKLNAVDDNIYLVLMGRKYLKNVALSIFALYDFKCTKGITKNIQRYTENLKYITTEKVKAFVTEDEGSGLYFLREIDDNSFSIKGAPNYSTLNGKYVLFLDALGFGAYITEFMNWCYLHKDLQYIMWDSFEVFLLRNVFKYLDVIESFNLEDAYTVKLNEVTNKCYSKHTGCCGSNCNNCKNTCKHFNCDKILFTAYPELRNKIISSKVDQYLTSLGLKEEARQAELNRLGVIANASGCTVEDIINDLI